MNQFKKIMSKNKYKILCFSWHAYLLGFFSYVAIGLLFEGSVEQNKFWEFSNRDSQGLCITIRFIDVERVGGITELVAKRNVKARQADINRKNITLYFDNENQSNQVFGIERRQSKDEPVFDETETITFPGTYGNPQFFPFDYITYNTTMEKPQDLKWNYIRIYNHLQGFHTSKVDIIEGNNANQIKINFRANRNTLYRAAFIASVSLSFFFFVVIIFFIDDEKKLATSVLGYVISLWTIKKIITTDIKVPTGLVDYFFIFFIVLVGFGVIEKIILLKRKTEKQNNK